MKTFRGMLGIMQPKYKVPIRIQVQCTRRNSPCFYTQVYVHIQILQHFLFIPSVVKFKRMQNLFARLTVNRRLCGIRVIRCWNVAEENLFFTGGKFSVRDVVGGKLLFTVFCRFLIKPSSLVLVSLFSLKLFYSNCKIHV